MTYPPWDPSYYAAYLPPGFDLAEEARLREASRSDPFIIIDYRSRQGVWRAWWTDKVSLLGELDGTREEVIAWSRERCDDRVTPQRTPAWWRFHSRFVSRNRTIPLAQSLHAMPIIDIMSIWCFSTRHLPTHPRGS